jgi:hypothetical protein
MTRELSSLDLSEKANQLAHDAIGIRCRRLTTGLLVLSAVLGYAAGFTGLGDVMGNAGVTVLAFLAGVTSTGTVLALTMLKSGEHLRFAGAYEQLLMATMPLAINEDAAGLAKCRDEFSRVVGSTRDAGVSLSQGQVRKYERMAREWLRQDSGVENVDAELLNQAISDAVNVSQV